VTLPPGREAAGAPEMAKVWGEKQIPGCSGEPQPSRAIRPHTVCSVSNGAQKNPPVAAAGLPSPPPPGSGQGPRAGAAGRAHRSQHCSEPAPRHHRLCLHCPAPGHGRPRAWAPAPPLLSEKCSFPPKCSFTPPISLGSQAHSCPKKALPWGLTSGRHDTGIPTLLKGGWLSAGGHRTPQHPAC